MGPAPPRHGGRSLPCRPRPRLSTSWGVMLLSSMGLPSPSGDRGPLCQDHAAAGCLDLPIRRSTPPHLSDAGMRGAGVGFHGPAGALAVTDTDADTLKRRSRQPGGCAGSWLNVTYSPAHRREQLADTTATPGHDITGKSRHRVSVDLGSPQAASGTSVTMPAEASSAAFGGHGAVGTGRCHAITMRSTALWPWLPGSRGRGSPATDQLFLK